MKKAIFLDKAHPTVRIPLQMQNLDTIESMTAVTLQFLQHDAKYQAGVTISPDNRRGTDDMEIDAVTKEGKNHKGKGKSKTDGQKPSYFVCGRVGHMTKDCWFKDTSMGVPPNSKGKKGKGKGKSKGKNSANEVTTPTEPTVTPAGGTSTSQISRITQDDTWDRPVAVDEDEATVRGLVCCTRFGGQLRGLECVFSARHRMDCSRTKQESQSGISKWTQAETLWPGGSTDDTS